MTTPWSLELQVQSSCKEDTDSLAAALITDAEVKYSEDGNSFTISLAENQAKDLRAMWNTRIRGLIAVDNVLKVISKSSSTSDE